MTPTRLLALLLASSALTTLLPNIPAADFHVAPHGNDQGPGTLAQPFATLERARDQVRAELAKERRRNLIVEIHAGTYRLTAPVTFSTQDSPGPGHTVTYRARPGENPAFSGGRLIEGWQVREDGTWSVILPEAREGRWTFRELFANGTRLQRARHPNTGWLRVEKSGPDRRTSFTFNEGDVKPVPGIEEVELLFLHDWSTSRIRLKGVDEATRTLTVANPIGTAAAHYAIDHFEPHPRYCLENARVWVDTPGEWHLDPATGELVYFPHPGESPGQVEFVAPVATRLLSVTGNPETGEVVRNLHFIGLTFEHCAWPIPRNGYAGGQAAFHEQRDGPGGILRSFVPPALEFKLTEGCAFTHGRLAHLGGSGIWFEQRCNSNLLAHTLLTDISGNGVMLGEDTSRPVNGTPWWRSAPGQVATGNEVRNCLIEHCGQQFLGSVGLWGGFTRATLIANNEIRQLPYTGISLGWMWNPTPTPCRENVVEGNHIHHVMQTLSDGGGIYTLGLQPGSVLRHNRIHDIPLNLGRAESNGMFLDEGTTDVLVADNIIYNLDKSPLRFHRATTNLVTRNLLITKPGIPPIRYNNTTETHILKVGNIIAVEQNSPD